MKDVLNSEEISRVIMFNQDEQLKGAIKKIMLADIYNSGTVGNGDVVTRNWAYNLIPQDGKTTNAEIGENLRAHVVALSFLEEAFKKIETYQSKRELQEEVNPAL